MADPRLTIIADAVLARVASVTIAGGYNFDAGTVARGYKGPDGHPAYPVAVLRSVGFPDRGAALVGDSTKVREATAIVALQLYTTDSDDPQKKLELWAKDCVQAIEGDPLHLALTAYVHDVTAVSFEPLVTDLEIQKPFGSGVLGVHVRYRMGRGQM